MNQCNTHRICIACHHLCSAMSLEQKRPNILCINAKTQGYVSCTWLMFILEDGVAQLGVEGGQAPMQWMDVWKEAQLTTHTTIHVGWTDQLSGSNCPAYHTWAAMVRWRSFAFAVCSTVIRLTNVCSMMTMGKNSKINSGACQLDAGLYCLVI